MRDDRVDITAQVQYHVGTYGMEDESPEDRDKYPGRSIIVSEMDGREQEEKHVLDPRLWLHGIRDDNGGRYEVDLYFDGRMQVKKTTGVPGDNKAVVLFEYNPYETKEDEDGSGNGEGTSVSGA